MYSLEMDQITSEFMQGFNHRNMMLFVGLSANKEEIEEVAKLPWACVVTSRRDEDFKNIFSKTGKRVREYVSYDELPNKVFDRDILPVIRLYGVDNQEDMLDEDAEIRISRCKANGTRIWNFLLGKLDVSSQLNLIGYRPRTINDIDRIELVISLDYVRGGSITFFGMDEMTNDSTKLKKIAIERGYKWVTERLSDLLKNQNESGSQEFDLDTSSQNNLFWIAGKSVSLKDSVVLPFKGTATMLTDNLLYAIRPFGRIQQSRWFLQFLTKSAESGPQWYGYLRQSEFYLKREYEDVLFSWVKSVLHGQDNNLVDYSEPIILEGDPGSSKSIELAALAFNVYEERQFPVIYVTKKELSSRDFDVLDEMMMQIKALNPSYSKTLIIWDGSAYSNISKTAKEMARYLANRGRRFVLVCSAYHMFDIVNNQNVKSYKCSKDHKIHRVDSDGDINYIRGCYYIHATRELTERESIELKNIVKQYCPASAESIIARWKNLKEENNNNIFYYFYQLMVILQPPLEENLRIEHRKVSGYVQQQLDRLSEEYSEEKSISVIRQALLNAGVSIEDYEESEFEDDELSSYDLERFNTCVALFSRFKIETPIALALSVLRKDESEIEIYGNAYKSLFNELTSSIPWIIYKENSEGFFCFVYRSQLEADIFLRKDCRLPISSQVDLICKMLEHYQGEYKRFDSIDYSVKNALQKLLRMIGPNSDYPDFKNPGNNEHKQFLDNLPQIIEKLQWLRKECKMPDADASFAIIEVTFIREFYSEIIRNTNIDEMEECSVESLLELISAINRISDASVLAHKSIEQLERMDSISLPKNLRSQSINSLTVEVARCSMILNKGLEIYHELSKCGGDLPKIENPHVLPYRDLYRMLIKVIYSDPLNGYSYNALFSVFKEEYQRVEKKGNSKLLFQMLSEIQLIADDANDEEIHSRGVRRDELGEHLAFIKQKVSNTVVSIDDILGKKNLGEFGDLFADMLANKNPAAICFVCRQELAKVQDDKMAEVIAEERLPIYQKVRDFMRIPEYYECVEQNAHALFLLLQVTWACYAKRTLNYGECKLTNLSKDEWKEVLDVCEMYEKSDNISRPIVILIHALAEIQLNWDYEEAGRILSGLREEMFFGKRRTSVPYMVCENGKAKRYDGKVVYVGDNKSVRVRLDKIYRWTENSERGILYPKRSFFAREIPEKGDVCNDLEIGVGYMGFSLYTEEERRKKEEII